jgi:D-serine deaminase-like pyridoxal phosphate-dependent protein
MGHLTEVQRHILRLHPLIDTPALILSEEIMDNNLSAAYELSVQWQKLLRPHTKTHKSIFLAKRQLQYGAKGITVAKLSEAMVMADAGIDDIFIANQITHPLKLKKLRALHDKIRIIIGIDNKTQINLLKPFFENSRKPLEVRIEINCGQNRAGIIPEKQLIELAAYINKYPWLKLDGIYTHAGQAYGSNSIDELSKTGFAEGECAEKSFNLLKKNNIHIQTVSVGSTPTLPYSIQNKSVTEVRPGNYIFRDAMQIELNAAEVKQCALFILSTVTSHPQKDIVIIDAGSKTLTSDTTLKGDSFGIPLNLPGKIERLSEEHGIIVLDKETPVEIGMPVLIIPNHACPTANLFDNYTMINKEGNISILPVSARGKSQ